MAIGKALGRQWGLAIFMLLSALPAAETAGHVPKKLTSGRLSRLRLQLPRLAS